MLKTTLLAAPIAGQRGLRLICRNHDGAVAVIVAPGTQHDREWVAREAEARLVSSSIKQRGDQGIHVDLVSARSIVQIRGPIT